MTAMTAMPADADPLVRLPARHIRAHRIDDPDNLVPRYTRVSDAGEGPQLGERIAVTYAASLDLDPDVPGLRHRYSALDQFEGAIGAVHLYGSHT
jgi:hypothetical protein